MKIAVYGTLKSAFALDNSCVLLGAGTVPGRLFRVTGTFFPTVVLGDGVVHVDTFEVPDDYLPRLDRYEGVASDLFSRVQVTICLNSGEEVTAYLYVAGENLTLKANNGSFEEIVSGVWE